MLLAQRLSFPLMGILAVAPTWNPAVAADTPKASDRPNILWIISDDQGPDLGCYGTELVKTPNLDGLAKQGVRYTNAFTTAPICSPSRSAFMTGMYQTSIGAHHHRSHRKDGYTLPDGVKLLSDYFREAGYYTCNGKYPDAGPKEFGKTDFNFKADKPFDGTNWRQRGKDQSFFAQVNLLEPHRGKAIIEARKQKELVDPAKVTIPPCYPDTAIVRDDIANYYDAINLLDTKVGDVLKRLEKDGLADSTIVFFFSDNGRCQVRGKGWLFDGGLHVPLIIRIPEEYRPAGFNPGTVRDDLVSAIDITATSLKLAGIEPPKNMHGQMFLGKDAKERKYVFGARDRFDETVDRIRSVHTKQYNYIRNFMPEKPWTQANEYRETNYPILKVLKDLNAEGKLTPEQKLFMAAKKPAEELYDLKEDPHELHNLVDSDKHKAVLKELRDALSTWMKETKDQGAEPEKEEAKREK